MRLRAYMHMHARIRTCMHAHILACKQVNAMKSHPAVETVQEHGARAVRLEIGRRKYEVEGRR